MFRLSRWSVFQAFALRTAQCRCAIEQYEAGMLETSTMSTSENKRRENEFVQTEGRLREHKKRDQERASTIQEREGRGYVRVTEGGRGQRGGGDIGGQDCGPWRKAATKLGALISGFFFRPSLRLYLAPSRLPLRSCLVDALSRPRFLRFRKSNCLLHVLFLGSLVFAR